MSIEISSVISESMTFGLRKDSRNPRNSVGLTQLVNAKVISDAGRPDLVKFDPIATPVTDSILTTAGITKTFPFPQLIRGKKVTFLLNNNTIWTVNEGTGAITQLTTYDAYDRPSTKSVTAGGIWHFMDFYDSWMFFNGTDVIFNDNREEMYGRPNKVFTQSVVTVRTGCDFLGRWIMGGFTSSNFYTTEWENFWRDWLSRQPVGLKFPDAPGGNFVSWGIIGGGDMTNLFYLDNAIKGTVSGAHDNDRPLFFETQRRNEAGFAPMPFQGNVEKCMVLGKNVIVYGEDGIVAMQMAGNTLGIKKIADFGVADRGAIGGTDKEHVFVDESGYLYRLRENLVPEKLGYQEFFDDMLSNDIAVTYDPGEDEYYICDSSLAFVLTRQGLSEHKYLTTSVVYFNGGAAGIFIIKGSIQNPPFVPLIANDFDLATDTFDMGLRSLKTIERVSIECTDTTGITVAIDWRHKVSDATFTRTNFNPINDEGDVAFPITAIEFRIVLHATNFTLVDIDPLIRYHWKVSDKRGIRSRMSTQQVRTGTAPIVETR